MSQLNDFIMSLEDFELLALYKYRYNTFLKGSQIKIMAEIERRGLSLEEIDDCIESVKEKLKNENKNYCPRCFSRRFYRESEVKRVYNSYYFTEKTIDFQTCLVCLHRQDKK